MTAMVTLYCNNHCEVLHYYVAKLWKKMKMKKKKHFCHHKEHDFRRRKVIYHDRSRHISHTTYFFNNGSRKLMLLAQNINFFGLPVTTYLIRVNLICFYLFTSNMSYRLPLLKILSCMTNSITAIMSKL